MQKQLIWKSFFSIMKKEVMIYMIPRDHYMTQFFRFRGQPLIKVITGMRR